MFMRARVSTICPCPAARRAKHRAALLVDRIDRIGVQHDRVVAEARNQSGVTIADADRLDAVIKRQISTNPLMTWFNPAEAPAVTMPTRLQEGS